MLPRSGSGTAPQSAGARAGPGPPAPGPGRAGPARGSGPPAPQVLAPGRAVPVPGPLAAASGLQQFYQCCACNELFSSAKNVRIHFARMQPQAGRGRGSPSHRDGHGPSPSPVPRRVRQPHGASDSLKAAHSGVACQWQLVQINSAARALALGGRSCTGPPGQAPAGAGLGGAGPQAGPTTAVCPGPMGPRTAGAQDSRHTDTDLGMPDGGGCGSPDTDPGTTRTI